KQKRVYEMTSSTVFRLRLRIVRQAEAAEEVTLDVYNQIWNKATEYDASRGTPWAWILMMARSRALDYVRSKAYRAQTQQQPIDSMPLLDESPSPYELAEISYRRRLVLLALESLTAEQREAIELAFFSGLSHTEIGVHLGQPLGTIKTRIRVGMMRLKESLETLSRDL